MAARAVALFPFEEEARQGHHVFEDGEIRWAASDLARWAGAADPDKVRLVVDDHTEEFERLGSIVAAPRNPGPRGGRPGEEYYLNFEQALLLCMFLRSPKAAEVRIGLCRVAKALVEGRFVPAVNDTQSMLMSMADVHRQNALLLQKMDERQSRVEADVTELKNQSNIIYMTAKEALALARKIAEQMPMRRRGATMSTAAICKEVNWRMFDGRCPRCGRQVLERQPDGTLRCVPGAHLHHHFGRDRNHPAEMCYVCADCNHALEDPIQRGLFTPTFQAIVIVVNTLMNRTGQFALFEEAIGN